MRYAIISDIHSNLEALDAVIYALKNEAVDQCFCVGDIVGYASNPSECVEKTRSLAEASVAGNHDWAVINFFALDNFTSEAQEALLWTRRFIDQDSRSYLESLPLTLKNQDFTLVHGTLDNPRAFEYIPNGYIAWETFRLLETKICFIGHRHIPGIFTRDKSDNVHYRQDALLEIKDEESYIVNVGSVGQPRDGNSAAAYCIYDTQDKKIQIKRVNYETQEAKNKIIRAGLPRHLGDRLIMGQ